MKNIKIVWKTEKFLLILGIFYMIASISFNNSKVEIDTWLFIPGILILLIAFLKDNIFQIIAFLVTIYFWGSYIILKTDYSGLFQKQGIFITMIIVTIIYIYKIIKYLKKKQQQNNK